MPQSKRRDVLQPIPTRVLYLGVLVVFSASLLTLYQVVIDWRGRVETSRARALYEMVHTTVPTRPTDTPGVVAWLNGEVRRFLQTQAGAFPQSLLSWQRGKDIPPPLDNLGDVLLAGTGAPLAPMPQNLDLETPTVDLQLRTQFFATQSGEPFVVTRRTALGAADLSDPDNRSNRFLQDALTAINAAKSELDRARPERRNGVQIVRFFALCEDGTMVTKPYLAQNADADATRRALQREGAELRKRPLLPSLVSNEFFFTFDYSEPAHPFYSGLYLDLAGSGLIASLSVPLAGQDGRLKGLIGMDIAFDIDWDAFTRHIGAPLEAALVSPETEPEPGAHPWRRLVAHIEAPPALKQALLSLASTDTPPSRYQTPTSIHHGYVAGTGALTAFAVKRGTWLVLLFPHTEPRFPWFSTALLVGLFLALLVGFEWSRYRGEVARRHAVAEFNEKQNLLNSMNIPLSVVDPNTEEVIFGNQAAQELGIRPGRRFRELIPEEPAVREHYEHMQFAGDAARRAYGLPLDVPGGRRYAVIRSIAVTAPIAGIQAEAHHRLGVLFILEPQRDLGLYNQALVTATQQDIRNKLTGLLNHGVDTLARVLHRTLARGGQDAFALWLAGYVSNRIHVIAWLLSHWEETPPLPAEYAVSAGNLTQTLQRLEEVFAVVRDDAHLRAQLNWNNGVLAESDGEGPVFEVELDWPEAFQVIIPLRGGMGFFLHEVLVNAVRHGCPGDRPLLRIELDPVARQIHFCAENRTEAEPLEGETKAYGGKALLASTARLFGWHNLRFSLEAGKFRVGWSIDAVERADQNQAD
ncbi:hypothetical protein [Acanthopleuribacter pedis]|uniref:PAS domain-containing protein n=1 Tax=Acanthopleuribacter pedis TaxID=442870 RepID=A0A8J7QAJ4_9BACT|nr:hypothetical protein [Acanthopleuribacter pedis]MBO1320877.1 hypothetical protein [Acanthopleuribacter pedis]